MENGAHNVFAAIPRSINENHATIEDLKDEMTELPAVKVDNGPSNLAHYVFDELTEPTPTGLQSTSSLYIVSAASFIFPKDQTYLFDENGQLISLKLEGRGDAHQLFDEMPMNKKCERNKSHFPLVPKFDNEFWLGGISRFIFDPGGSSWHHMGCALISKLIHIAQELSHVQELWYNTVIIKLAIRIDDHYEDLLYYVWEDISKLEHTTNLRGEATIVGSNIRFDEVAVETNGVFNRIVLKADSQMINEFFSIISCLALFNPWKAIEGHTLCFISATTYIPKCLIITCDPGDCEQLAQHLSTGNVFGIIAQLGPNTYNGVLLLDGGLANTPFIPGDEMFNSVISLKPFEAGVLLMSSQQELHAIHTFGEPYIAPSWENFVSTLQWMSCRITNQKYYELPFVSMHHFGGYTTAAIPNDINKQNQITSPTGSCLQHGEQGIFAWKTVSRGIHVQHLLSHVKDQGSESTKRRDYGNNSILMTKVFYLHWNAEFPDSQWILAKDEYKKSVCLNLLKELIDHGYTIIEGNDVFKGGSDVYRYELRNVLEFTDNSEFGELGSGSWQVVYSIKNPQKIVYSIKFHPRMARDGILNGIELRYLVGMKLKVMVDMLKIVLPWATVMEIREGFMSPICNG